MPASIWKKNCRPFVQAVQTLPFWIRLLWNTMARPPLWPSWLLTISPWDTKLVEEISKAIMSSDIGINPIDDGRVIRLNFPAPTEERRKQLTKDVSKLGEESKVAVRNVRRDALDKFKAAKKKSEISEDELANLEDEMQKITDKFVKEIEKICESKNKEIMEL